MSRPTRCARLLAACAALALSACTARYSQTLIGSIEKAPLRPVTNSSEGYGLTFQGFLSGPGELVMEEPESAEELANPSCEAVMAQVDYRGLWVFVPIGPISFFYVQPKVQTVTFCASK